MSNGIKTFFKVFYIALGVILAAFVAIIAYNNYAIGHIQSIANEAVKSKDYTELERIFGTFFSTDAILDERTDKYDLVVYPSVAFSSYTYYNADDEAQLYEKEDYSYYIYVVEPSLDIINDVYKSSILSNESGIRLFFDDDTSFLYYFTIDQTYNTAYLQEKPTDENSAILYTKRNTFTAYSYLNYFDITITSSIIDAAKAVSNSNASATLSGISLVDSSGRDVAKYDVLMDFSQDFYTYIDTYVTSYNNYILEFKAASDNDTKKELTSQFENFFYGDNNDGFYYTFSNNLNCGVGYGKDYAYPGWLYLQAGGMTLLFIFVLFLLYMLLFHFGFLRSTAEKIINGSRRRNVGRKGNVDVSSSRISKVNKDNEKDIKEKELSIDEENKNNIIDEL